MCVVFALGCWSVANTSLGTWFRVLVCMCTCVCVSNYFTFAVGFRSVRLCSRSSNKCLHFLLPLFCFSSLSGGCCYLFGLVVGASLTL